MHINCCCGWFVDWQRLSKKVQFAVTFKKEEGQEKEKTKESAFFFHHRNTAVPRIRDVVDQ
jgi:hypothetical protein